MGAIGNLCAVLTMLTLLQAALVLLGRAAFWPRRAVPGADAVVRGYAAVRADFNAAAARDRIVLPLLVIVVLVMLVLLLRSLVAPVVLMATVLLSYLAAIWP